MGVVELSVVSGRLHSTGRAVEVDRQPTRRVNSPVLCARGERRTMCRGAWRGAACRGVPDRPGAERLRPKAVEGRRPEVNTDHGRVGFRGLGAK